ncbi:MAG: hypothetical protein KH009_07720 [Clostridiales bacterium]|nr:hypothetical protein [Clostridiales bacterium]
MIVSTNNGDFIFQSADDVLEFVQTAALEKNDIWISGEQPYPCLSICINGEYAAVHFFQNDTGEMWLSYDRDNQEEVSFIVGGEEWKPDTDAIIRLNDAFLCIREFLDTCGMPSCIQWQAL